MHLLVALEFARDVGGHVENDQQGCHFTECDHPEPNHLFFSTLSWEFEVSGVYVHIAYSGMTNR